MPEILTVGFCKESPAHHTIALVGGQFQRGKEGVEAVGKPALWSAVCFLVWSLVEGSPWSLSSWPTTSIVLGNGQHQWKPVCDSSEIRLSCLQYTKTCSGNRRVCSRPQGLWRQNQPPLLSLCHRGGSHGVSETQQPTDYMLILVVLSLIKGLSAKEG